MHLEKCVFSSLTILLMVLARSRVISAPEAYNIRAIEGSISRATLFLSHAISFITINQRFSFARLQVLGETWCGPLQFQGENEKLSWTIAWRDFYLIGSTVLNLLLPSKRISKMLRLYISQILQPIQNRLRMCIRAIPQSLL